jgi:hypothetical protein
MVAWFRSFSANRCRRGTARRAQWSLVLAVVLTAATGATAHADPPVPVDYRSEVSALEPPTDRFEARIVGGDAFLEVAVRPGTALTINGYQDEPYLRFGADGTVEENQASPTFFVSASRQGGAVPEGITADTPPDWVQVASDGTFAWHDHRTHWMGSDAPRDKQPGDQILETTIAVMVDGTDTVEIVVRSFWEPAPSPIPVALGVLIGAALAAALMQWRRRPVLLGVSTTVAAAALTVGLAERASLPPETGPAASAWLLPTVALAAIGLATILARRLGWLAGAGLLALAGVNLTVWAWVRRAALTKAVLPTDLPWWIERVVTAAVLLAAPFIVVAALRPVVGAWRAGTADPTERLAGSKL